MEKAYLLVERWMFEEIEANEPIELFRDEQSALARKVELQPEFENELLVVEMEVR